MSKLDAYGTAFSLHIGRAVSSAAFDQRRSLTVGCRMRAYGPGFLSGDFYLKVANQTVAYYPFDGWIDDEFLVEFFATVPASNSNRNVDCTGSTNWGYFQAQTITLEGSGPYSVNFKVAAFIAPNWVYNPYLPGVLIFAGDNRSFNSSTSASKRFHSLIGVLNPATSNGTYLSPPAHQTGQTQEYDKGTSLTNGLAGGVLTSAARADTDPGWPMKTRWANATTANMSCNTWRMGPNPGAQTSRNQTGCTAAVNDPLVPSPAARWAFTLTMDWGNNRINWILQGCTGWYPHYEFYLDSTGIYLNPDSGNPFDLGAGCIEHVDRSGSI